MADITVRSEHADRYSVRVRDHSFVVDQPIEAGGDDAGPTPTELFVTGLAACVAFYAGRFLRRHDLPTDGLRVLCDYEMSGDHPSRVTRIDVRLLLPAGFPAARREALSRVVERCTVSNSLRQPPVVAFALESADQVA